MIDERKEKVEERYRSYIRLRRYKRVYILVMPVSLTIYMLIWDVFEIHFLIAAATFMASLYVATFWFLSKNNCPWCGQPFFAIGGFYGNGIRLLLQTRCQHCNKPDGRTVTKSKVRSSAR